MGRGMQAAFVTEDEATVETFTTAQRAYKDWAVRFHDELVAMEGVDSGRIFQTSPFLSRPELYALSPESDIAPEGWVIKAGRRGGPPKLEPRRGKAGDAARAWLERWQPPRHGASLVAEHGAPTAVATPSGDGRELIHSVQVLVLPAAIHLMYEVEPTEDASTWSSGPAVPDARWQREPLSSWHLAYEDRQRASEAEALS